MTQSYGLIYIKVTPQTFISDAVAITIKYRGIMWKKSWK